jgi:hypothetical protein
MPISSSFPLYALIVFPADKALVLPDPVLPLLLAITDFEVLTVAPRIEVLSRLDLSKKWSSRLRASLKGPSHLL